MAGDWIKMRTALAHDPAVIAMALDLDKNEFEVVGMLHHIWSWADSQSQDGHIKRVTEKWLDRFVHCDGFSKSMESAKWLVISSDGIEFPNFGKHNGESAKKRAEAAERQRISRELKALSDAALLSQKTCDESVTREEKRREEEKSIKSPHSPKGKKEKAEVVEFDLPNWVGREAWNDFLAMRKSIKKPLSQNAMKLAVKKLSELSSLGQIADDVLNQSTLNSWQGLFEVKNGSGQPNTGGSSQGRPSLSEQVRQRNAERQAERDREEGQGAQGSAELWPAGMEKGGRDFEGEFSRIRDIDGKIVEPDDGPLRAQMD